MTHSTKLCGLCGAHGHLASDCPWQGVTRALDARMGAREEAALARALAEALERRRAQPEEND